jgi:hypothetical protein
MAVLAAAVANATPFALAPGGEITVRLDEPNPIHAQAIEEKRAEIVAVLQEWFSGVEGLSLAAGDAAANPAPKRLTDEMLRSDRLAALRKRDPVLGAAIDALDLDVAD